MSVPAPPPSPPATRARAGALGWALGAAAWLLYLTRLCPTISAFGDSAELCTAAALWGVPHPPGYPLLTAIGHAFTYLPFGSIDWRLHLTSAVFHALCVVVVYQVLLHLSAWVPAAVFGAVLLALSRTFLMGSLYYETFPLNDLCCALVLLAAVKVDQSTGARLRPAVLWLAVALAVAGAHHHLAVLFVPATLLITWPRLVPALREVAWWRLVLAGLVPYVLCAGVLLGVAAARGTGYDWGSIHDLSSLWHHLTRGAYGGPLSASVHERPWAVVARQEALAALLAGSLGPPALLLAAWGGVAQSRHHPRIGAALVLTVVLTGPIFFALNRVPLGREEYLAWSERFAALVHVPLCCLAGLGLWHGARALHRIARWQPLAVGAVAVSCLLQPIVRSPAVDLSDDRLGYTLASDLVTRTPDGSVIVLASDQLLSTAEELCLVHTACGQRLVLPLHRFRYEATRLRHPELALPSAPEGLTLADGKVLFIIDALIGRRPVYVDPSLLTRAPGLQQRYQIVPDLLLLRVEPPGAAVAALVRSAAERALTDCQTCRAVPMGLDRPTMHAATLNAYRAGLQNLARFEQAYAGRAAVLDDLVTLEAALQLPTWDSPVALDAGLDHVAR